MSRVVKMLAGIVALSVSGASLAAFPDRPVKLVVPFPAGGLADTVARVVAERLGAALGQTVIVDYKAGAATIVGADSVATASPDGYTLLLGSATTFAVNPIIYRKLPYDPLKSFEPIGIVGSNALALLANHSVAANSVKELIGEIKAQPDKFSYGSHGAGSTVHFAAEMLWSAAGAKVLHIPYKGSAPALTDLMGGQIALAFDSVPAAIAAAKGGRVKILATTGKRRAALLPNVPTIVESGYPVTMEAWWAVVAPHGIPAEARERLVKALKETMTDSGVHDKLVGLAFDTRYGAPAEYAKLIEEDTAKLAPIAKANNIHQE
ncbi:ABC transporter substrate-binding protein [Bordetella genomosp. 10]|uniref:ABC transporter substrate-binding protein n=2 Tax=Bordetella genomosp. 10 TaxID=1416804 RepID=A0A261SD10_9BORD|nr:ABC transporter substrate-binding protein [Bordetella genomosp. 10]